MTSTIDALDALHPAAVRTHAPARGSDADQLTGGALALIAALRVAPAGLRLDDAIITADGHGTLVLLAQEYAGAEQLALALDLPAANRNGTEVDDLISLYRWSGRFADWPVQIHHYSSPEDSAPAAGGVR